MSDRGAFANLRSGRFSIPKFASMPSELGEMRSMSTKEKDAYVEKKLLEHKRALYQEFEVNRHQTILESVCHRCFNHCVNKPGNKLTNGQKKCIEDCTLNLLDYQGAYMGMLIERARKDGLPGPIKSEWDGFPTDQRK
eukprot:jgi/Bigna1/76916/fgenesh1_pg.44_\